MDEIYKLDYLVVCPICKKNRRLAKLKKGKPHLKKMVNKLTKNHSLLLEYDAMLLINILITRRKCES